MSNEFRSLLHKNLPQWYRLSWLSKESAISIGIHQGFIENIAKKPKFNLKEHEIIITLLIINVKYI